MIESISNTSQSTLIIISVLSILFVLAIAKLVTVIGSIVSIERTGTDEDDIITRTGLFEHILQLGLVYPAIYVYVWLGIWCAVRYL